MKVPTGLESAPSSVSSYFTPSIPSGARLSILNFARISCSIKVIYSRSVTLSALRLLLIGLSVGIIELIFACASASAARSASSLRASSLSHSRYGFVLCLVIMVEILSPARVITSASSELFPMRLIVLKSCVCGIPLLAIEL